MPLYLCRWPHGNLAIVAAWDRETALIRLDEFGNPDHAELREIDDLLVNLQLTDHGELQVGQWGDASIEDVFGWAYPELDAALAGSLEEAERIPGRVVDRIEKAVERERTRLEGGVEAAERPRARTTMGRKVQDALGAPAALADHLADQVEIRILEEAEIDGPEN